MLRNSARAVAAIFAASLVASARCGEPVAIKLERTKNGTYATIQSVGAWNGGYLSGAETVSRLQH